VETTLDDSTATEGPVQTRAIDTSGLSLRSFAARGVIVNAVFDLAVSALILLRGLVLSRLLSRTDFGVWGVLVVTLGMLAQLKMVGIADKYIQQEDSDQELAFQKAFTLELLLSAITIVPLLAALPAIAVIYGHWKLIGPGALLTSAIVAYALQAPLWIFYRKMQFARQRAMAAVEPAVGFAVAVALALLGAGYWALAVGLVAGAWSGALIALANSPYRLRWRFDRRTVRVYASFSGPVFIASLCSVVVGNSAALSVNAKLGLAGVGAVALAATITQFTTKVDDLVGVTLYPAICAIQHRLDLLRESFVKSNRLALMWAMPFGAALSLFAGDLVRYGIGEKWHSAILLLRVTGAVAAVAHVAWNWDDYFRARADTKPFAIGSVAATAAFLACLPLIFSDGLTGVAVAISAQALVYLVIRAWYVTRLFEGFRFLAHAMRAMLPTVPAIAVVLVMRALESGSRTEAMAIAELCVYVVIAALATWRLEGGLLREAADYVTARTATSTEMGA
jgi:O-antigen/teichoic acid export membrane protein